MAELRQARDRTERIVGARREGEDLRDRVMGDRRGNSHNQIKDRLGPNEERYPRKRTPEPIGFKLIVKNFPPSMNESEFYSMFIRKGELHTCEMKKNVGFVTYKTRMGAENAKKTLDGTKNGSHTLSVKDAPRERPKQSVPRDHRPEPPPAPTGIFGRLGSQQREEGRAHRTDVFDRLDRRHGDRDDYDARLRREDDSRYDRMDMDRGRMNVGMGVGVDNNGNRMGRSFDQMGERMGGGMSGQMEVRYNDGMSRRMGGGMGDEMSGGMGGGMSAGMGHGMSGGMGSGMSGGMRGGMSGGMGGGMSGEMDSGMSGGMGGGMSGEMGSGMSGGMGGGISGGMGGGMSGGMGGGMSGEMGGRMS